MLLKNTLIIKVFCFTNHTSSQVKWGCVSVKLQSPQKVRFILIRFVVLRIPYFLL